MQRIINLSQKLGELSESVILHLNAAFGAFRSLVGQMQRNNLSHKLGESCRMGHSGPDGQIQRNYSFSQSGRIKSSGLFRT